MSLHAFIEYLKYMWVAKGRHGTHSPYVYRFVEEVLQNKNTIDKTYIVTYRPLPLKYENLICRIAAYNKYRAIAFLPPESENAMPAKAELLLLKENKPLEWANEVNKNFHLLPQSGAIIAIGIHNTALHTKAWKQLCNDTRVKMSIDIYGIGLLLFRDEFKERQHFVLKY